MSKSVLINSGLLTGPSIMVRNDKIVSRSNLIFSLLTLFTFLKNVSVDPTTQIVRIQRRIFWLFKSVRDIPFEQIRRIDYEYSKKFKDITPFNLLVSIIVCVIARRTYYHYLDTEEDRFLCGRYIVSVVLEDSTMVKLWAFSGRDDSDSLYCVEYLQYLTDKPLI